MINIEAEGLEQITATLDSMVKQIDQLGKSDMADELTAWQSEDMRRRYPNTKQEDDKTVSTEIWPRSRLSDDPSKRRQWKPVRRVYAAPRTGTAGGTPVHSTRPVLREELFTMLVERMDALLSRVLEWQTKA